MSANTDIPDAQRSSVWRYVAAFAVAALACSIVTPFLYGFVDAIVQTRTSETAPHAFAMAALTGAVGGGLWAVTFRLAGDLRAQLALPWLGTFLLVVAAIGLFSAIDRAIELGAWPAARSREFAEIVLYAAAFLAVFYEGARRFGRW